MLQLSRCACMTGFTGANSGPDKEGINEWCRMT